MSHDWWIMSCRYRQNRHRHCSRPKIRDALLNLSDYVLWQPQKKPKKTQHPEFLIPEMRKELGRTFLISVTDKPNSHSQNISNCNLFSISLKLFSGNLSLFILKSGEFSSCHSCQSRQIKCFCQFTLKENSLPVTFSRSDSLQARTNWFPSEIHG